MEGLEVVLGTALQLIYEFVNSDRDLCGIVQCRCISLSLSFSRCFSAHPSMRRSMDIYRFRNYLRVTNCESQAASQKLLETSQKLQLHAPVFFSLFCLCLCEIQNMCITCAKLYSICTVSKHLESWSPIDMVSVGAGLFRGRGRSSALLDCRGGGERRGGDRMVQALDGQRQDVCSVLPPVQLRPSKPCAAWAGSILLGYRRTSSARLRWRYKPFIGGTKHGKRRCGWIERWDSWKEG